MTITLEQVKDPVQALLSKPFITGLDPFYPNISDWYHYQVVGRLDDNESVLIHAYDGGRLVGVSIAKRGSQTKLRCVRVTKDLEGIGLGIRLINHTLELLEQERPLITVSEELFHQYSRAFHHYYNFKLEQVAKGLYRKGKLEYVYNQPFA